MSIVKFELKKQHIALIKNLCWDERISYINIIDENDKSPFGGESLTEDLGLILFGKPEGEFDPNAEEGILYTPEQVSEMIEFYVDLPTALQVVTNTLSFEEGFYKRRFHETHWKKFTPKVK